LTLWSEFADTDDSLWQKPAGRPRVTRLTIISLEANRHVPSLLLAFRIAKVLGVTVEEVFRAAGKS